MIIDLTSIRDKTGPARLLEMIAGRSKNVFKTRLAAQPQAWHDRMEMAALDEDASFKTAINR